MKDVPRSVRLNSQLQAELSAVLRSDLLRDPRVTGVNFSVTSVAVTRDMANASVLISSLLADDARLAEAVKGLNHAAGAIRHAVGQRVQLRYVPQLHFHPDNALREGDRIAGLITKALAKDRAAQAKTEEPPKAD